MPTYFILCSKYQFNYNSTYLYTVVPKCLFSKMYDEIYTFPLIFEYET